MLGVLDKGREGKGVGGNCVLTADCVRGNG